MFTTCTDEESPLGFAKLPSIRFVEAAEADKFIPTANTCGNSLMLPHHSYRIPQPQSEHIYSLYDYAFANGFFGNV